MSAVGCYAAVDLGASSGRVMLGRIERGVVGLEEVARFPNGPITLNGSLFWDITRLYTGVLDGLRAAADVARTRGETLVSIGIDTWAVDYALIGADGAILGLPFHYRDSRTDGVAETIDPDHRLYRRSGIAPLPFNTVFQLESEKTSGRIDAATRLLMVPDLLAYWLTGVACGEVTNASTTGLLDSERRDWDTASIESLGLRPGIFPPVVEPGQPIGPIRGDVAAALGLGNERPVVVAVGTHDTASAVVAVPARTPDFAYIASGTWSLVGLELPHPVRTEEARAAGFTNEAGVDGTVRFLRNVMGMWLVQESMRHWADAGHALTLAHVLDHAAALDDQRIEIDPDLPVFLPPGDMPGRIAAECERTGQRIPTGPGEIVRCMLDSLAAAYRRSIESAERLSGRTVDVVHIVGGGSQNELLCRLTAEATGKPVVTGPVEASALGNVLVQARTAGAVDGGLRELRAVVAASTSAKTYEPAGRPVS